MTWEEIQRDIQSLVGTQVVKDELLKTARILGNIKEHQERHGLTGMPPLHFAIHGPAGSGKKHIAGILSKLLQYYQLAAGPLHIVTVNNMEYLSEVSPASPIYVPVIDQLLPKAHRPNALVIALFWTHLQKLAQQQALFWG